jgi:DNA-binding NtrC family response regulator
MSANKIGILIIEDEEAERLSLAAVLVSEGFMVDSAENGVKALELVKKQFFDVLIVDYKLPDIDGIDLIKQMLQISKDSVPILATGFSSLEVAVESMRIGAHDYMVKPVNIDELKKNIENIVIERDELTKGKKNLSDIVKRIEAVDEGIMVVVRQDSSGREKSALGNLANPFVSVVKQLKRYFWDVY